MRKDRRKNARGLLILMAFLVDFSLGICPVAHADNCGDATRIYDQVVFSPLALQKKIEALRKASGICPNLTTIHVELANLLLLSSESLEGSPREQNKLVDEAAAHLERAIQEDDSCVDAYRVLARIYYTQGRFEMARTAYEGLLTIQPGMREAKMALKELEKMIPLKTGSLKTAGEIKKSLEAAPRKNKINIMGIQSFTVPRHRERFNNITFGEWSFAITRDSESQLQEIKKALSDMQGTGMRFAIEGHTDNRGDINRNQTLSENRAQAVRDYLVASGIDPSRITTQGFGLNRPLVSNDSPANMAKNRRVEILFFDSPKTD